MIKETIIPTSVAYTLNFPENWIGKTITILYGTENEDVILTNNEPITNASDIFDDCKIDLSNYKFNRSEANDY